MLRRTGSTLPKEVFLADEDEYEEYICDVVLPSLDARCIVLSRILAISPATIEKYQFRPFAMLFSSFEEILFLDADAFHLDKPEASLPLRPFPHHGASDVARFLGVDCLAALLRDRWHDSATAGAAPSYRVWRGAFVEEDTCAHAPACYILHYWRPSHYYPLLSQGAAGEGDKETFLAAASAMHQPFYQVSEPIVALGHRKDKSEGSAGSAMAQFNPVQDHTLTRAWIARVRGDNAAPPDVFFNHANFPKFNPATVFEAHEVNPAFTDDREYTRAWTIPEEVVGRFSQVEDVEMAFWKEVEWAACELEKRLVSWRGYSGICERVSDYWRGVFEWKPLST